MRYLEGEEANQAEVWMYAAADAAKKGLCLRAKCGAVIVKDGEVIGEGFNAPPQNNPTYRTCLNEYELPQNYRYDRTCCMHSEWRAILEAVKNNPEKVLGAKLYFCRVTDTGELKKSGEPYCTVCSRFSLDVGIAEFFLWHEDGIASYPTDEYDKLSFKNLKQKK